MNHGECRITLPSYVFDKGLFNLLEVLGSGDGHATVRVDLQRVKYYIPAAMVAVLTKLKFWVGQGVRPILENYSSNDAFRYLQRIDFFSTLGINLPEDFRRHTGSRDFVPINEISASTQNIDQLASDLASSVVSQQELSDAYFLLQYACGEAMLNCKQHAAGPGFVSAQYAAKTDFARIGIADCGIGILESFRSTHSPHYREGMTDADGLQLALTPGKSSKTHLQHMYGTPPNVGIGLTMLRQLMQESYGFMFLASGRSMWLQSGTNPPIACDLSKGRTFHGTILSLAFMRGQVVNYFEMVKAAKAAIGLPTADSLSKLVTRE